MGGAFDQKVGGASRAQGTPASPTHGPSVGKRTLTEQLPVTGSRSKPSAPTDKDWSDAGVALGAAADVMANRRSQEIAVVHSKYSGTLWKLYAAMSGAKDGKPLTAAKRNELFQDARRELTPAIDLYASTADGRAWLGDYFYAEFNAATSSFAFSEAKERVHNALLVDPKHAVEMPADTEPREQGHVLHIELAKLLPAMRGLNEQMIRMNEHGIEHEAEALIEHGKGHGAKAGSLAELANVLMLVDAWLLFTDEELKEHLSEIHGVFNGVSTYAELIKAVTELTGGAIGVTASVAAGIARATGNAAFANAATGIARKVGLAFADVVAGIEIVHGVFVMLDPHATRQEKTDGAVDVAAGGAWFGGRYVGGAAVGFAASSAVLLGYAELKWALSTYWQSSVGINTMFLSQAYETLAMYGESIARAADELAKAHALVQQEKDPAKREALLRVEAFTAAGLGDSVDSLIADCGPVRMESGVAAKPGAYPVLRELFAPVAAHRGAKAPDAAAAAAALALEKIVWARTHAADIVLESTRNRDLGAVEADAAERERKPHEENHDD